MRLKVLLVKPYGVADEIIPPISLGMLATQIRNETDVRILDALKERLNAVVVAKIVASEGYDVVGFQAWSKDIHEIKMTCSKIKEVCPRSVTIVGGIHPTMVPEGTLRFFGNCLDYAFKGEGEIGFKMFLELYSSGNLTESSLENVPGLVWRVDTKIKVNRNDLLTELDSLGFPAWDLMPPLAYPKAPHGAFYRNFPIAPIIVTRGCPFPCTFCAAKAASGGKLRTRSLDHVLEELKILYHKYGVREFQIEDDNFTLNNKFVEQFCGALLSLNLKMTWSFPNGIRLDTIDRPLLRLMRKSGCYALNFGVESGSQRILDMIKKRITLDQIMEQLTMSHEEGFDIGGFFIVGFPTETKDEIEETINFACSLPLDRVGVSYFQPFPGTPLFYELVENGEIKADWVDSHHTSLQTLTYVSPTITVEYLRYSRKKMLRSFYFRPKTFVNMLRQVRSPSHLYYIVKRSIRWLRA